MQSAIKVTAEQLRPFEGPFLKWKAGSRQAFAIGVGQPKNLRAGQLAFVGNLDFLKEALATANFLIVEEKFLPDSIALKENQALWTTPSLKAAMAVVLKEFDPRKNFPPTSLISPQAFVHPSAKVGTNTRVDAGASIGAGAIVGDNCHLHPNVVIEDFCQVGNHCILHAGCVIGSDGFGFLTDPTGQQHKIPQIGIVVLEDHVEIGALTTIDRATISETRICRGTKFDNLCHVAHNSKIGENSLIAAGVMVAGSTIIGKNFAAGGNAVVTTHIEICDNVMIGGLSGVAKSVTEPGMYTGYPLQPLKDGLRTLQNLTHVTEMRTQLRAIAKKIGLTEESK